MLYRFKGLIIGLLALIFLFMHCAKSSSYEEIVERELSREEQFDSLFMGIHFNMHMQTFYDHCFEMNQKGLFFKNQATAEVLYIFQDEFSSPVNFVFFPEGGQTTIQKMKGSLAYQTWSPFTKTFTAGHLQEELKIYMEEQYGGRPFLKIPHPQGHWPYSYVKIDGNRQIHLYRSFDDSKLEVVFENLK